MEIREVKGVSSKGNPKTKPGAQGPSGKEQTPSTVRKTSKCVPAVSIAALGMSMEELRGEPPKLIVTEGV